MSKKQHIKIKTEFLELNNGQLKGLPKNPRFIKDEKFNALVQSVQKSPEFLDARPLLVYPLDKGKYIVLCGNMRLRACRELGMLEVPCYVFPKSTPIEKLREYTIKDNMEYGQIDWETIANEWDAVELKEWNFELPEWEQDELPEEPEELTQEDKNKPFVIKIVCEDIGQLQDFENDIKQLIEDKYNTANYSVSGGEL
jgi:hypothetical protein